MMNVNALKLNFQFDAKRIREELQAISKSFKPLLSTYVENEALEGIHLINPDHEGKIDENGHTFHMIDELKSSPYLQEVLDTFKCNKLMFRTQNLKPQGKIEIHTDRGRGIIDGIVRLNIPVTTNDEVYFHINEERIIMKNGECWLPNVVELHEVENRSDELRLQLVIDCELNDWWKDVLKENGMEYIEPTKFSTYSLEELMSMKDSYVLMNMGGEALEELELEITNRI